MLGDGCPPSPVYRTVEVRVPGISQVVTRHAGDAHAFQDQETETTTARRAPNAALGAVAVAVRCLAPNHDRLASRRRPGAIAMWRLRKMTDATHDREYAAVPDVAANFHTLEIEDLELVDGTAYNDPDTPEQRVKMQLRVRTPTHPDESFVVWMSPS